MFWPLGLFHLKIHGGGGGGGGGWNAHYFRPPPPMIFFSCKPPPPPTMIFFHLNPPTNDFHYFFETPYPMCFLGIMLYFATSILVRSRIVQFWYVLKLFITRSNSRTYQNCAIPVLPELSDYTTLVHFFFQNCYNNSGTYQNCPCIIFLLLAE